MLWNGTGLASSKLAESEDSGGHFVHRPQVFPCTLILEICLLFRWFALFSFPLLSFKPTGCPRYFMSSQQFYCFRLKRRKNEQRLLISTG